MARIYFNRYKTFFLLIGLLCINAVAYAQSSIPFTITAQGHIMVKASINGVEGNFIFDTGAGLTVITKAFASKINGAAKEDGGLTLFRATGEKMTVDLYKANILSLGSFVEQNPQLTIVDAIFGEIDGLISLMSFRNQPFTIDYNKKQIVFETGETLAAIKKQGSIVPLQMDMSRDKTLDVFVYVVVNNKLTLQFCIDSGAGANIYRINGKYISALGVDTAAAVKTYHPSEFNPQIKTVIYSANLQSLAIKGFPAINVQNVKTQFIDGLIYDGIVWLSWIGKQVTFDLPHSEMVVR
ncbi:retropepsin-like aspartic protease [Mucilaginibacter sp. L196]|uniref:retropepsin-like aspartic protease n=1 Tax=Mucilaginibacter sp. L196 TaxID=1641870 RepID=UPI00131BB19A|nr:retropepsin-like aspartic protease [Mucilaginibacter sp. L196]